MTTDEIQAEIDTLFANGMRLLADGEKRAGNMLLESSRRLRGYLSAPVDAPVAPVAAKPEPVPAAELGAPRRAVRPSKGIFGKKGV